MTYFQLALKLSQEISVCSTEFITLENLAEVYQKLGNKNVAFEYCEAALAIFTALGLPQQGFNLRRGVTFNTKQFN